MPSPRDIIANRGNSLDRKMEYLDMLLRGRRIVGDEQERIRKMYDEIEAELKRL